MFYEGIVCTYGVKSVIKRVKEFGIQEMWEKYAICTYDQTYVGMWFFGILFCKEVCISVGNVCAKCRRGWSVWCRTIVRGGVDIFLSYNRDIGTEYKGMKNRGQYE